MPDEVPAEAENWTRRQLTTASYYHSLLDDVSFAAQAFESDFAPYRTQLATSSGRVLDVGGGNGLIREYLPVAAEYVSVDPDLVWLDPAWSLLEDRFACLRRPLYFVHGLAECLPFADETFDCAIALYSLNHCWAPRLAVREVARILRAGGSWLVALEDVEPGWRDVLSGAYHDWRGWTTRRVAVEKVKARGRGWPLESDHVRITERDMSSWIDEFFLLNARRWVGSYLTLELVRR